MTAGISMAAIDTAAVIEHGSVDIAGLPRSVADRARQWESSPLIALTAKAAPLPAPAPSAAPPSPPPPTDIPPPADLPPLPVKPAVPRMPTPPKSSSSEPVFLSPRSGRTIKEIASDIVAAELENGLSVKHIGRASPKLDGVSVYNQLARYVNGEMAKSEFVEVVDRCRQEAVRKFGENAGKLEVVEGSTTDAAGAHTGVNLKRIARFLKPVFDFVCGRDQRFADSRLPTGVLTLLKAIDRELVATLLARRKQQLAAQKLWSASLPPERMADELAKRGWTDAQFKKLVTEGIFTSAQIHAFRANMFSGLLFTRCVSPFILFSSEELQQDSSKRTATPSRTLVKLSEGANKQFKNEHADFVEDFIRESNSVLPDEAASALAKISSGEERFSKLKKSKGSPSAKSRTYKRAPGRHSAPVLPQGKDFRKLMEAEGRAHAAETTPVKPAPAPADYKALRAAAIDKFKSGYPKEFSDEDFSIRFNRALKQWKKDQPDIDIKAIPAALEKLYRQLANPTPSTTAGFTAAISTASAPGSASAVSSPPQSSRTRSEDKAISSISSPPLSILDLSEDKAVLLNRFLRRTERRVSFERYPELAGRVQEQAVNNAAQAGNFVLMLKEIFEEELIDCVCNSSRLLGVAPQFGSDELQEKVERWKKDHLGKNVTLEVLWELVPGLKDSLTLDAVKPSALTRNAEAVTEKFLQRKEVASELQNNPALKKAFLHEVRSWIAIGAFSTEPETTVQQMYHAALTAQYQEKRRSEHADPARVKALGIAAMQWWADNADAVLTPQILDQLFAATAKGV